MYNEVDVQLPYAVRVTFTKMLSPTSLSLLRRADASVVDVYTQTLQSEGERLAIDWVRQWIDDGSVIPTIAVVDAHGNSLSEGTRKAPVDPEIRRRRNGE